MRRPRRAVLPLEDPSPRCRGLLGCGTFNCVSCYPAFHRPAGPPRYSAPGIVRDCSCVIDPVVFGHWWCTGTLDKAGPLTEGPHEGWTL